MDYYGFTYSANSHRVRMMLAFLEIAPTEHHVDMARGAHKSAAFLKINAQGRLPALVDNGVTLSDSHAIVEYLCDSTHAQEWLPTGAADRALVTQWMYFDACELHNSIGYARNCVSFNVPTDLAAAKARARDALGVLDSRLAGTRWLALERPTLADIACYPLVAICDEGGLSLDDFPNVRDWIRRIESLPRAIPMPRLRR